MRKVLYFLYAAVCYTLFFGTFLYLVGFVCGLVVPKSIDTGDQAPVLLAGLIDIGLIAIFGFQHSVMARKGFKQKWTRIIPEPIERSTYVLMTSLVLILLLGYWAPITANIWDLSGTAAGSALLIISFLGWGLVLLSTFLINHFHLFGLQQVYEFTKDHEETAVRFGTPFVYKIVRHPLYLGLLIAFWVTQTMTAGHLLFAIGMTVYILIGIHHEERDLVRTYGEGYIEYRKKTPSLIPFSKKG